ncbi:MAG TPA: hypothetical protein VGS41_00535, partial [Chthonomonadales bacterium]|nr:hypothetical protein [Chthonomonadales bacterium]
EPEGRTQDHNDPAYDSDSPFAGPLPIEGEEYDFLGNLEAETTLQDHLRALMRAAVPTVEYPIGEYLISSLDHRGWLEGATESIASDLAVPEDAVIRVLQVLQSFDPPGVGARNLRECMLLQLKYLAEVEQNEADRPARELAAQLILEWFDQVAGMRIHKLARLSNSSPEQVRAALEYIRTRLNPFPAGQYRPPWSYRPSSARSAVRPDVIIRRAELGYEVDVVGGEPTSLAINPVYRQAYTALKSGTRKFRPEERRHFAEYVERAELFLRNLAQRRKTLKAITQAVVEIQVGFLETGSRKFLRPLTRTVIARTLSMHESTVSRATANKFVQLPSLEVVSFDLFFNASLSVKDVIGEIIHAEDPATPLSDQQIVSRLKERGIEVARRTVVKYRQSQKILSSTRRRRI